MDDIEAIKQLKARYFRTMDTKDWAGFRQVFADDLIMDISSADSPIDVPTSVFTSADEFLAFVVPILDVVLTVHQGHMPEIDITSPTTATGIWALEDLLRYPDGDEMRGYGHYHETYVKTSNGWRIKSSSLTRLRVDFSAATPTADA
jgi:hypothetical protein